MKSKTYKDEQKIGYDLLDIKNNTYYPIIRKSPFVDSWHVGEYYFDKEKINGLTKLVDIDEKNDLIVFDEIGPLELNYKRGLYKLLLRAVVHKNAPLLCVVRSSERENLAREINFLLH